MKTFDLQFEVLKPESCAGCGLCCENSGSPVILYASRPAYETLTENGEPIKHPFRPAGLPLELIQEIDEKFVGVFRGQEPETRCFWFDPHTRSCRHYEWRPQVCHEYELGGTACLLEREPYLKGNKEHLKENEDFESGSS